MVECQLLLQGRNYFNFNTSCKSLRSKIIINFIFTEVYLGLSVTLHDS